MTWRFTIIDRNDVSTVIEEPVGWADVEIELARDLEKHGIFDDYSGNEFLFPGRSGRMIKTEHDQYGIRGKMSLKIDYKCAGHFELLYTGKLLFAKYDYICGDECYAKIPIETTSDVMELTNKWEKKVDLQATKSFDRVTDLVPYGKLPITITIPSKGIFIQDRAETKVNSVESFDGDLSHIGVGNMSYEQIEFGLPDSQLSELGSFQVNATHMMDMITFPDPPPYFNHNPPTASFSNGLYPLNLNPLLNYFDGSPNYGAITNPVAFDIRLAGVLDVQKTYMGQTTIYLLRLPQNSVNGGEAEADYEFLAEYILFNKTGPFVDGSLQPDSGPIAFDFIFLEDLTVNQGDRFYLFLATLDQKSPALVTAVEGGAKAFTLTLNTDSHIRITNISHTDPTPAKVFMINEAISRVAEAITDDKIRAYSDYFGRPDSQPYTNAVDGYGSLEAITKGLFIRRQENRIAGKPFLMNVSMKDLWDGLDPIHHIGMGVESDSNRPGFNRLRVEHWKYFYNDTVIMRCIGVNKIERVGSPGTELEFAL